MWVPRIGRSWTRKTVKRGTFATSAAAHPVRQLASYDTGRLRDAQIRHRNRGCVTKVTGVVGRRLNFFLALWRTSANCIRGASTAEVGKIITPFQSNFQGIEEKLWPPSANPLLVVSRAGGLPQVRPVLRSQYISGTRTSLLSTTNH